LIVLGLGTNLGDRLANLRQAFHLIKKIPHLSVSQVSPIYISDALLPENAPTDWNNPYFNLALRCETKLTPLELLQQTKEIEKKLQINTKKHWGPRIIDIDLLACDDLILRDKTLHIPHQYLHERPFALWPLMDVAPHWCYPVPGSMQGKTASELVAQWGSKFSGDAPLHTKQIPQRVDTPQWIGIINLTPDSFSTDGILDHELGWQHIKNVIDNGADILDFGAEATGPNATPLNAEEEWKRLVPLLTKTLAEKKHLVFPLKISVDTRHAIVAEKALELGVDWINDVSGLDDPAMRQLVSASQCDIVFMHHLGIPVNKNHHLPLNQNPTALVYQWAEQRLIELEKFGIARTRLIFDPGIGYGKTAEQSLEIIKNINVFHQLGIRLLVGHSRKSFLTQFTTQPAANRDLETMLISLHLADQSVDYLRVHNIEIHLRGLRVAKEFGSPRIAVERNIL
jgi:2-amino-4-hydroxy-6-hydroxymethyldihydropteridine diphosphokinase/dihydropteroate synthase